MKKLFILYLSFVLLLVTQLPTEALSPPLPYEPPEVKKSGSKDIYIKPGLWTPRSSIGRRYIGQLTPEAAVVHFYTSLFRQDQAYTKVIPPIGQRSKKLQYALKEYRKWEFLTIQLINREKIAVDQYWITIEMRLVYKGRVEKGQDQVLVKLINNQWFILELPT